MNKKLPILMVSIVLLFLIAVAFIHAANVASNAPIIGEVVNNTYTFKATTLLGDNVTNVSWYYYNSTGQFFINSSINVTQTRSTWNATISTIGIADGNYTINVTSFNGTGTAVATGNFSSNSTNYGIIIDNSIPTIILGPNISDSRRNLSYNFLNGTFFIKNITIYVEVEINDTFANETYIFYTNTRI